MLNINEGSPLLGLVPDLLRCLREEEVKYDRQEHCKTAQPKKTQKNQIVCWLYSKYTFIFIVTA